MLKIDRLCFDAITSSPTTVVYKTSSGMQKTTTPATAKSALTAADSKLSLSHFTYLRTLAKGGNNRAFSPIRPIKIKGREWYVLLCYEDVLYDIKNDTNFTQAQREAQERSDTHPLFTGATAIYDQVVVHTHEFYPRLPMPELGPTSLGRLVPDGSASSLLGMGYEAWG